MARVPDTPCSACGRLLFTGRGSLENPTCHECRRAGRGPRKTRKWTPAEPRDITCPCGTTITVTTRFKKKYCSTRCADKYKHMRAGTCEHCGAEFVSYQSRRQRFCSYSCSNSAVPRTRPNTKPPSSPLNWRECSHCSAWFVSRRNTKYCGDECRRVHNIDKALGAYRLATTPQGGLDIPGGTGYFRRVVRYLAHRDGQRCAICNQTINLELPSGPRGNPLGPSIDHIIPRSEGGADTLTNVRLTHWTCNQRRGNRGGNEQLRLIG